MRLSIVIPVWNEEKRIAACLARLRPLIPARDTHAADAALTIRNSHEIIVVDGGSGDRTRSLARPLCTRLLRGPRGRGAQMNLGARFAGGDVLLFLHADSSLPEQAESALAAVFAGAEPAWGWFDVRFDGDKPVYRPIAALMNLRARLSSVCTGDQALFISAGLFRRAGGFPEIPLMEDIAICKKLRKLVRPTPLPLPTLTSPRRWDAQGVLRTVLRMWRLRLLYFLGVSPARLAREYYPSLNEAGDDRKYPAARILVFARAPEAGAVKTRLAGEIGAESALSLYLAMLRRVFETAERAALAEVHLWAASNPAHEEFLALCEAGRIRLQRGADLGERMLHAATRELAGDGVDSVLIVGSDCPALGADYLDRALAALAAAELVLGPARDGGYVLIGLRAARPELFRGVDWGSGAVLEQTLARARELGLQPQLLEPCWDVDTAGDLPLLQELRPPLSWSP